MTNETLYQILELPAQVQEKLVSYAGTKPAELPKQMIDKLRARSTWDEGIKELQAFLEPDPDGMKILWELLNYVCTESYEAYVARGIPMEIFTATMKFCTRFLWEHYQIHQTFCYVCAWWFPRQMMLQEFRIGALEYEFVDGVHREIAIHIPSDADMRPACIDASVSEFEAFRAKYFPDWLGVRLVCDSWMLVPALEQLVGEDSNVLAFQRRFEIESTDTEATWFMGWIFPGYDTVDENLPERTTLQRNLKKYLLAGHTFGIAKGTLKKTWSAAWLNYSPRQDAGNKRFFTHIRVMDFAKKDIMVQNAAAELRMGLRGMLGLQPELHFDRVSEEEGSENAAKAAEYEAAFLIQKDAAYGAEDYSLEGSDTQLTLKAGGAKGVLSGVFHLLRLVAMEKPLSQVKVSVRPDCPMRMMNHWDNMDGSIERGYSGNSFFFENNEVIVNARTVDYARLAASIGINGVVINNVNVKQAASYLITDRYFEQVARMAEVFAGYGIRFFLSLNYAASIEIGGLDSADPLDERVQNWWKEKMAEVFARIPNLGGFLVKADSEGRPGPFTYNRTQADGANMLADIVKPYGGIIIWRCFVYNCTQDWRDYKTDRARAGYDSFIGMDGEYHDNVILQIKNGPMDFQIREPVSPLLGGLKKTNQMLEVQVAQEYTGHQIDVCYLMPMFREILGFRTYCAPEHDCVKDIISGRTLGNTNTGIAAVINTGNDANWTGNELAAANFYGFGRLACETGLSPEEIAAEWISLTFGNDPEVLEKLLSILLPSRETYEKYTSPLGIGWMVTPHVHYGCSVDGYEYSRWGTYHRADHLGLGVDRSHKGTGYAGQYYEPNASMYDSMDTCPEELLLFFHHVPYIRKLKSGKTLIQHIYDTHFEGVCEVEAMISTWESLKDKIAPDIYANVSQRFARQLVNAKEWRDQVNSYFYRKSGIPDEKGRPIY